MQQTPGEAAAAAEATSPRPSRLAAPRRAATLPWCRVVAVVVLVLAASALDATSARHWGGQRSRPSRIGGALVTDGTTHSFDLALHRPGFWHEGLLLTPRRRNRALLTTRASVRQRLRDLRGGAAAADDDEGEEDEESEGEDEQEYDTEEADVEGGDRSDYDDEDSENEEDEPVASEAVEEEEETSSSTISEAKRKSKKLKAAGAAGVAVAYDEPLVASPFLGLYVSLGVMFLAKKVDLFSPTMVRIARFAFVAYLAVLQAFVLYVRIQAKLANDRTVITLTNPLSSVLQSQLLGGGDASSSGGGGGAAGSMMKNLASSFLSSSSTVMEYDLKQANSMQSGLLFNMALNWFLHFKMEQVQPLLIQSASGLINLVYSPLFQVYVMGRNLERPFPNPNLKKPPVASEESDATSPSDTDTQELPRSGPSAIASEEEEEVGDDVDKVEEQDGQDADAGEDEEEDGSEDDAVSIANEAKEGDEVTGSGDGKPNDEEVAVEATVARATEPSKDGNDNDDDSESDSSSEEQ